MPAVLEELEAKYLGEMHRWGDTVVIEVERSQIDGMRWGAPIKAKGPAEIGELVDGLWYRFWGRWTRHPRWGDQFHFQSFVPVRPLDEEGLVLYLCRAPFIGKVTARKIVKQYGSEAVREVRENPAGVAETLNIPTFSAGKAEAAAVYLEAEKATEDATVELMGLFSGRGLPRALVKKSLKKWGNRAHETVREDPYLLMAFRGVAFTRADELYLSLGHDPEAVKRQGLCAWYTCAADTEGHTWLPVSTIQAALYSKIGGTRAKVRDAVRWGLEEEILRIRRDPQGAPWLAAAARADAEGELADAVAGMLHYGGPQWPAVDDLDVSEHQREELRRALGARLALFGGSPGTGKTYSAARLISTIQATHGAGATAVCAPTGKAAVRITEALHEYGIGLKARTVHSLLEVARADDEDKVEEGFCFQRGPENPLEEQFVICDEASMLDTWLLGQLVRAMRMDGHLLLVGDVQQLPPVGHGAPLRDLLAAGVPQGELREIRRNAGVIVHTCAAIRDEAPWHAPSRLQLPEQNLVLVPAATPAAAADAVSQVVDRVRVGGEHDPVWECQVVVAVNEKSQLSRRELNARLQAELNRGNRPRDGTPRFWQNDKVVCLKNSWFPVFWELQGELEDWADDEDVVIEKDDDDRPQVYVANGELGRVVEDREKLTIVEFQAPKRVVLVPQGEDGTGRLDLGYALSVHKAQGSEWPIVVVAIDDSGGARMVTDRSWIYTAISRAKKACVLVGREQTAKEMCARVKIWRRKTFLVERAAWARKELEVMASEQSEQGDANVNRECTDQEDQSAVSVPQE